MKSGHNNAICERFFMKVMGCKVFNKAMGDEFSDNEKKMKMDHNIEGGVFAENVEAYMEAHKQY